MHMADSVTGSAVADEPNRQADGVEDVFTRKENLEESTDVDVGKSTSGNQKSNALLTAVNNDVGGAPQEETASSNDDDRGSVRAQLAAEKAARMEAEAARMEAEAARIAAEAQVRELLTRLAAAEGRGAEAQITDPGREGAAAEGSGGSQAPGRSQGPGRSQLPAGMTTAEETSELEREQLERGRDRVDRWQRGVICFDMS